MATRDAKFTISAENRFSRVFESLKADLASSQARMNALSGAAGVVNSALGRIVFPALAGAGLVSGVQQLAKDLDKLNDVAEATGSTVENLSALERVARRNGDGLDLVATGVLKLNKALADADPNSPVSRALTALGLNARELRDLDPALAIQRVAQALVGFEDGPRKAQVILAVFNKSTREAASFLKDLAESGELVVTVTAKQAAEAERFVKNLNELKTSSSDTARALVSDLLPALNNLFALAAAGREVFGSLGKAIAAQLGNADFANAALGVNHYTTKLDELRAEQKRLVEQGPTLKMFLFGQRDIDDEIANIEKLRAVYERVAIAQKTFAGGGRGFVNPAAAVARPTLPDLGDGKKQSTSEAQRLVESLEKQIQAEQHLTEEEKVRLGIETKLYDGMTPKLEARTIATARFIDQLRLVNKELEREAGFQKLLLDKRQSDINEGLGLLESTPRGQRENITRQVDLVLNISRASPGDEAIQAKANEALAGLRKRLEDIGKAPESASTGFEKLADTIEKSMERSTDAVLDFIVDSKGGFGSIFSAFRRDLLRQVIEEPLRDSMKNAVNIIRQTLQGLNSSTGTFANLFSFFASLFGGGGGGGGTITGGGGITPRASGGPVRAGQMVRWQESGREFFVPGSDGTVINPGQARQMGGGSYTFAPVVNVNGDVGPQTVALVQAMLAKQQAAWMRSMRTGGAMAVV